MPNHIKNKLELLGSINDIDLLIKKFGTHVPASASKTDSGLIICLSKIEKYGYCWLDLKTGIVSSRTSSDSIGLPDDFEIEINQGFLAFPDFEKVIPPPDDPAYKDLPNQKEAEKSPNWWYRWNIDHWGTKWGAYSCERPFINVFTFETAWSSVPIIINTISKQFPHVTIKYKWADEDTGFNCGYAVYQNGLLEEVKPKGGTKEAYDIAFELRPERLNNYELVDGNYKGKEED